MDYQKSTYWQNAEITSERIAMMGLFVLTVSYCFFGWINLGIF